MLHKPPGVVSAARDTRDRTVIDVVPTNLRLRDLSPVGRLDKDATGLLLLTNDGALLHRLTHPKRHVPRTYALTWEGLLPADAVQRVAAGIALEDGTMCMPAELVITAPNAGTMTVHQGMYHQVKRMIVALGGVVTTLHRTQYGPLSLGELAVGATRALTPEELASIGA
jgi:16S rRNA pseudouridine516 synthase